jgi:hypothetical protein
MCGHYGSMIVGVFSRPFNEALGLTISFGGIEFFSMEDCAPSIFLGSWVMLNPYLCFKFHIFDRPILGEYVSQVEGGLHMF